MPSPLETRKAANRVRRGLFRTPNPVIHASTSASPFTVTHAMTGTTFICTTTGGDFTYNLPRTKRNVWFEFVDGTTGTTVTAGVNIHLSPNALDKIIGTDAVNTDWLAVGSGRISGASCRIFTASTTGLLWGQVSNGTGAAGVARIPTWISA